MSYHDGIFIPPLIVTGLLGALGRIHLTPGKRLEAAMSSGRKLHPAPLSPCLLVYDLRHKVDIPDRGQR